MDSMSAASSPRHSGPDDTPNDGATGDVGISQPPRHPARRRLSINGTAIDVEKLDETFGSSRASGDSNLSNNKVAQSIAGGDKSPSPRSSGGRRGSRAINVDFGPTQLHLHRSGSFVVHVDSPNNTGNGDRNGGASGSDISEYEGDDNIPFNTNKSTLSESPRRNSASHRARRDSVNSYHSKYSRHSRRSSQATSHSGRQLDDDDVDDGQVDAYLASQGVDPRTLFSAASTDLLEGDSSVMNDASLNAATGADSDLATQMFQERLDRIERALLGGIEASHASTDIKSVGSPGTGGMSGAERFDERLRASTRKYDEQTREHDGRDARDDEDDSSEIVRDSEDHLVSPIIRASVAAPRADSDVGDRAGRAAESNWVPPSAPPVNRSPETTRGSVWASKLGRSDETPLQHQHQSDSASAASGTNDSQLHDWNLVNSALQQAGFNAVSLRYVGPGQAPLPESHAVLQVVRDLLVEYERRGRVIQDTVVGMDTNRKRQQDASKELRTLQAANRKLEQQRDAALGRARQLEEDQQVNRRGGDADARSLRLENDALKQRLAHSENRVRAKETVAARLQEKLDDLVGKQKEHSARTNQAFRQLHRRAPRHGSSTDQQTLEAMGSLEEQREKLESELDFSRAEITRLSDSLVARDNLIERLKRHAGVAPDADLAGAYGNWQAGAATGGGAGGAADGGSAVLVLEQIRQAERKHEASKAELAQRETALVGKVATLERQITKAQQVRGELEDTVESLKLELSSRPSKRDWNECQKRIRTLESQVEAAIELVEEEDDSENGYVMEGNVDPKNGVMFIPNARMNNARRRGSHNRDGRALRQRVNKRGMALQREGADNHRLKDSRALMREDRLNHVLGLNRFRGLSRDAVVELLLGVCRELDLTNVELVVSAVVRLKESVKDLRSLKRFASEVVSVVDTCRLGGNIGEKSSNSAAAEHSPIFGALERVTGELKRWQNEVKRVGQLERFRDELAKQVEESRKCWQMKKERNGMDMVTLVGHSEEDDSLSTRITDDDILEQMRELVAMENAVMTTRDAFRAADDRVKQHPDLLISRVIKHFQHLFGVRSMEGMFPKLNELYVFASEMTNFLKVLRPMLGLSSSASVNTVLVTLQDALQTPQDVHKPQTHSGVKAHESTARQLYSQEQPHQDDQQRGGPGRGPSFAQQLLGSGAAAPEWA